MAFVFGCLVLWLGGACNEEGRVILKLSVGDGQKLEDVSTLSFHFQGTGLKETPKPVTVNVSDGEASLPSLPINENATEPWFDARVFGLDASGKVVAFGAMRLPLISKVFEYTLFFSKTEDFVRLTKFDDQSAPNVMPSSIVGHTVLPLRDGRILIAGGATNIEEDRGIIGVRSFRQMVGRLILYDPTTGIFDLGPAIGNPRAFHTASLLPDGRVLLAGGLSYIRRTNAKNESEWRLEALQTFEIYDPRDESLTAAGRMASGRAFHTATTLSDGTIVFVGGILRPLFDQTGAALAGAQVLSVEVYNPDGQNNGKVAELAAGEGRFLHQAVAVNDKVVVTGGMGIASDGKRELRANNLVVRRASGGKWGWVKGSGGVPRYEHSLVSVTVGEQQWAVSLGGRDANHKPVAAIDVIDADGKASAGGNMGTARYGLAAATMNNQKILVVGGMDSSNQPVMGGELHSFTADGGKLTLKRENGAPKLRNTKGRYKAIAVSMPFDARVYVVGGANYVTGPAEPDKYNLFVGNNTVELYTPTLPLPADGQ